MQEAADIITPIKGKKGNQYRLPGIQREGIAQLSLLETALWPLQGGKLPSHKFETTFTFKSPVGMKSASVVVRSPMGLQQIDEYILWGLLGATLTWKDPDPVLIATPYWLLQHLGIGTGGKQYIELRESILRLATTSYQNTAFWNPETKEREYVAFQFLSFFLPTVGGIGERVDNDRTWRIEWNPAFFRFCKATGGNLLFDLELYRRLSPASRRLFLKLKDRFWRDKRVFLNVDDLTINGLGFSAQRPLKKRKFDLMHCIDELLFERVIELGRGQTDPKELLMKRGKGSYVVVFYEGEYFRQPEAKRTISQKNAIFEDPLYEPLRIIGVDGPGIRRLLKSHSRNLVQRWISVTEAAMNEKPRGFAGFKTSPAAFLIDGVQNNRTPPDWMYSHQKGRDRARWEFEHAATDEGEQQLRQLYDQERTAALQAFVTSPEGESKYGEYINPLIEYYKHIEPHSFRAAARQAALARIEKYDFSFPDFAVWALVDRSI